LERVLAQVTQFEYHLKRILRIWILPLATEESEWLGQGISHPWVYKLQSVAVLVALMGCEEFKNAFIAKIAVWLESCPVNAVDERVGEHISNSLDVDNDQVASS